MCACNHERYGYKLEGKTLSKAVKGSLHMLRQPMAWAVQRDVLDFHDTLETVIVTDEETNIVYSASPAHIRVYGFDIERGAGHQVGLSLAYWTQNDKPGKGTDGGLQLGLL